MRRARGLPRATWGSAFAHAGIGVALIGIVCETTWNSEFIGSMKPDDVAKIAGYELKLEGVAQRQGPNFREMVAQFTVRLDGKVLSRMTPSKRNFTTRGSSTTEAALLTRGASQLYISLGETAADGAIAVRIYHKPLVLLIWFGPVLMAFGGLLSLSDRRLRVGAPKPAKSIRGSRAGTATRKSSTFWSRATANSCCSSHASTPIPGCSGSCRRWRWPGAGWCYGTMAGGERNPARRKML